MANLGLNKKDARRKDLASNDETTASNDSLLVSTTPFPLTLTTEFELLVALHRGIFSTFLYMPFIYFLCVNSKNL